MANLICPERDDDSAEDNPRGRGLHDCADSDQTAPRSDSPAGSRLAEVAITGAVYSMEADWVLAADTTSSKDQADGEDIEEDSADDANDEEDEEVPEDIPEDVSEWSLSRKFAAVIYLTGKVKLTGEIKAQFAALMSKETILWMAGGLALYVVSQFFGIGEIVDVILLVVGWFTLGWSVFNVADDLWVFLKKTKTAKKRWDLDKAATRLARAIVTLGVVAFMSVVSKLIGKTPKQKRRLNNYRKGLLAEKRVSRAIGTPRNAGPGRVTVPGTGPGGYRIPDFDPRVTIPARGTVVEVKNVQNLQMTDQLRDW